MYRQVLLFLSLMVAVPTFAQSALTMTTSFDRLTITNTTRGGRVVLAGVSIQSENGVRRERRFATMLTDTDSDGRIDHVPEGKVPRRSIWVAVDFESGSVTTASGPGFENHRTAFPETALKKNADSLIVGFEDEAVEMDLLIVTPRRGAWLRHAVEGEEGDEDKIRDDKVKVQFASAIPVLADFRDAPKDVKKDDVIALIDVRFLRLAVMTIDK